MGSRSEHPGEGVRKENRFPRETAHKPLHNIALTLSPGAAAIIFCTFMQESLDMSTSSRGPGRKPRDSHESLMQRSQLAGAKVPHPQGVKMTAKLNAIYQNIGSARRS